MDAFCITGTHSVVVITFASKNVYYMNSVIQTIPIPTMKNSFLRFHFGRRVLQWIIVTFFIKHPLLGHCPWTAFCLLDAFTVDDDHCHCRNPPRNPLYRVSCTDFLLRTSIKTISTFQATSFHGLLFYLHTSVCIVYLKGHLKPQCCEYPVIFSCSMQTVYHKLLGKLLNKFCPPLWRELPFLPPSYS